MALVDVLIPTFGRKAGLATTLTSLPGQSFRDFDVVVADQTDPEASYLESPEVQTVARATTLFADLVNEFDPRPETASASARA